MQHLFDMYANYPTPALGYATVRDYCDSFDNLNALATRNLDLKDVQRPWILKAILASIPRGARLLEIGAGEPIVADMLSRLGYSVTIVDPYDGSGNGPVDFAAFKAQYPAVKFIRETFSEDTQDLEPHTFDCIYSISVLEHVPILELPRLCAGIRKHLNPQSGTSIHAIDHILKGNGDAYHLEHLLVMADLMRIGRSSLSAILAQMAEDTDTYFLSAESHNRWRGPTAYDSFPMRKVVSVHLNLRMR